MASTLRMKWTISGLLLATAAGWMPCAQAASQFQVLHAFTGGSDGGGLWGSLTLDAEGNLYGTTTGTIFELTPAGSGQWDLAVLHAFHYPGKGGSSLTCNLIFGPDGSLYGTTALGGGPHTAGTIFRLSPTSNGWKLAVLYRFGPTNKAIGPYGGLIRGPYGALYGVGVSAFRLHEETSGWKESILHQFSDRGSDGWGTAAGLIRDSEGNLYGATEHGGGSANCGGGCGTVFELSPTGGGKWKEAVVHRFDAQWDGAYPGVGALILDSSGNLYGTVDGGTSGYGVIFKMSRTPNGHWKETVLYNIADSTDGNHPAAGVVMGSQGELYGTTIAGGDPNCDCGVVYKLTPGTGGAWTYEVLHRFVGTDGAQPDANLIIDGNGNLYGTTATGGAGGYGVAFEVTP
jgi:uncharacterized repeat protein (TIGR03803 family)